LVGLKAGTRGTRLCISTYTRAHARVHVRARIRPIWGNASHASHASRHRFGSFAAEAHKGERRLVLWLESEREA
jgi:hypothetical protein